MERYLKRKKSAIDGGGGDVEGRADTPTSAEEERSPKRAKRSSDGATSASPNSSSVPQTLSLKNDSVSDTLLIPLADLSTLDDFEAHFRKMAQLLLNEVVFWIGNKRHRITELEFYVTTVGDPKHSDPFTHGDEIQKVCGNWYFHRTGNAYRGGSYKGLDICLGSGWDADAENEGAGGKNITASVSSDSVESSKSSLSDTQKKISSKVIGGILFRGIEALDGNRDLVDGPSLSVDHILKLNRSGSVPDFVNTVLKDSFSDNSEQLKKSKALHLEYVGPLVKKSRSGGDDNDDSDTTPQGLPQKPIISCPRVGLSLKNASKDRRLQRKFLFRDYRFLTEPKRIKKGKHYMVLGLHRQGLSDHEIYSLIGTPLNTVRRYVDLYKAGRDAAASKGLPAVEAYYGETLSTDDLCKLCGAIDGQKE